MRKAFALILTMVFAASILASCDQLKKLTGDKTSEDKKKIEEMAAEIGRLQEEKRKAEEQKKMQEQIDAEVAKRLAEMQKTAETQPQTQPTTQPTTQVIERVIIKEATDKEAPKNKQSGYVRLYDDKGFTDRILTVRFGRDIGNMHNVSSDDGKSGFNDKASSVKYSVPAGYQAVLYENNNYSKRGYALKGTGSIADLGYFGDKCSSLRWEKAQ